jgi:CHAT domain-containing protein
LAEGASVVLLPQGGLGLLPLHTAWRREASGERRYFLDDYTMAYAPSGYALATSRNRLDEPRRQQQSLLAVVDATKSLTFAPAEVEALAALFAEPKPRVLPPEQASREAVLGMAATCNYLHFACHGSYPLCQESCRLDRIGNFGGVDIGKWLDTDKRIRTG